MKNEDLNVITDSIKEKLGDEATALIADDLGLLISENTKIFNEMNTREKEITRLKENNEKLVLANGKLLQQVPIAHDNKKQKESEEDNNSKKSFSLNDVFDKNGHFKKTM